ncbi:ABC transporter permease [Gulosibacter sediminis]|uniref:ABC transporter permease n=1 Tax=Gulosibacter sediminis TaxID=1729695 RepID=UPI0024AE1C70|nr:ABC transporter permease [Gulosibacter sediminis]
MSATAAAPASTPRNATKVSGTNMIGTYVRIELVRQLRQVSNLVFMVGLPLMLFFIFGAMQEYSTTELPNGNGNVSASIMVSFASYGAITATAGLAGSAAIELQQGWGRQLGITPFRGTHFLVSKTIVAMVLALLPVGVIFLAGALTTARLDGWIWVACGVLVLVPAVVFSLYGLAIGTLFRSETAVGAASGMIVIFMFLGNAFMPLSGFLFDLSPFTPVWGVMQLALWPLQEGTVLSTDNLTQYEVWQPITNVVVWGVIFAGLAVLGARRGTSRR